MKSIRSCFSLFLLMFIDACKMHNGSFQAHLYVAPYLVLFGNEEMEMGHFSLKGDALSHATLHARHISPGIQ